MAGLLSPHVWVLLLLPTMFLSIPATEAKLELINNGFEGVIVAISPRINETHAKEINLLQAIKEALEEGSKALFEATHHRVFFRKVDILIPYSWSSTAWDAIVRTNYRDSQIHVDSINPIYLEQPYTVQVNLTCGAPGEFIHLTPQFLTDEDQVIRWGNRGKNIASEWAKFRWGIFDELGYPDDKIFPLFYQGYSIVEGVYAPEVEPTFCADNVVKGDYIDRNTSKSPCKYEIDGTPDINCRFHASQDNQEIQSSLLSYINIGNNISLFCDDDEHHHNSAAPTKQNLYCNRQSAWRVIMQHQDFTGNRNPTIMKTEQVQFRIVKQESDINFVLVLDYSGSMSSHDRIGRLQRATQSWIRHDIGDGNSLGIVKFSSGGSSTYTVIPLTKISHNNRERLASLIDAVASGGTCIGCGLNEALKILKGKTNCVILVLTDGAEGESPKIADVNDDVVASGCRAVTLAFGPSASQDLEVLAMETGGRTFSANDDELGEIQLTEAFTSVLEYEPKQDTSAITIKISDSDPYFGTMKDFTESFVVDEQLGRNLEFRMTTDDMTHITKEPVLIDPDGNKYPVTTKDNLKKMWIIQVETAKSGTWWFEVGLSGNPEHSISSTVTCQPDAEGELPITVSARTSAAADGEDLREARVVIIAEVYQGNNPVMGADVIAFITLPDKNTEPIELELLDSGNDPDAIHGDGIYTRYLTGIKATGRLIVKVEVKQANNSVINKATAIRKKRAVMIVESEELPHRCCGSLIPLDRIRAVPTGNFTRSELAGSVKITGIPLAGKDIFPPSHIRDLTVRSILREDINTTNRIYYATLTWTAPGDDLDIGIVNAYNLRFSQNHTEIYESNFNMASKYDISPEMYEDILQEAGTMVFLNMSLELTTFSEGFPYFFAINAEDEEKNASPVSNIVRVILTPPPPPPPPKELVQSQFDWIWIAIGAGVIVVVGSIIAAIWYRRKPKEDDIEPFAEAEAEAEPYLTVEVI